MKTIVLPFGRWRSTVVPDPSLGQRQLVSGDERLICGSVSLQPGGRSAYGTTPKYGKIVEDRVYYGDTEVLLAQVNAAP